MTAATSPAAAVRLVSAAIHREYDELHRRVSGTHDGRSVHDTMRIVRGGFAWPQ